MITNVNIARTSVVIAETGEKLIVLWIVGHNPIGFQLEKDLDRLLDVFGTKDTGTIQYARIRTGEEGKLEALGHITEDKWFEFPAPTPVLEGDIV